MLRGQSPLVTELAARGVPCSRIPRNAMPIFAMKSYLFPFLLLLFLSVFLLLRPSPPPSPPPAPPPPRPPRFLFPSTDSPILPNPSAFLSSNFPHSPLPTSSFFQNFLLSAQPQPELIHPYLIQPSPSSLSLSYPSRLSTPSFILQPFVPDLTISSPNPSSHTHLISAFDDLSLTLDLLPSLRFFLVRGSPFITFSSSGPLSISSSPHTVLSLSSNPSLTKHNILLSNNHTYLLFSSSPFSLSQSTPSLLLSNTDFSGIARLAFLPSPSAEPILDRFSPCYPVSGTASLPRPFSIHYTFATEGPGDLLLLAHPLHLRLLHHTTILNTLTYNSIDGPLVGVVGKSWLLTTDPVPLTWHSIQGVRKSGLSDIILALSKDINSLTSSPITTPSSYFYGKAIARGARLALIAEEVGFLDAIPAVQKFLNDSITPWLDGTFGANAFLYDPKWGGIVTKQGSVDSGADFGFGIYNDHHYHLGYFLYAMAVLSKIDPAWGRQYKPQAYSMVADILTLSKGVEDKYTRLRCFDLWTLHSWAGGLTEFADGRNQESTSEAVNGYYSAALLGMSYGDADLVAIASTLMALEIKAAETWWHVREGEGLYEDEFSRKNRVVGVLWANKRDSGLWFAPAEWKECLLGIQVLPLVPVTEVLFRDVGFAKNLVEWAVPALAREGVREGWKGFVYALEGIYDESSALEKTRALKGFDDGNSLSNLLWWLHSRGEEDSGIEWARGSWLGSTVNEEDKDTKRPMKAEL